MKGSFDELCREMNINQATPSDDALARLRRWYFNKVSQDSDARDVLNSARSYLDHFLPNKPAHLEDNVQAFDRLNTVQYAAAHGYDRFLETLHESTNPLFSSKTQKGGMTPLHLAATYGHVHAVEVLLARGASPYQLNHTAQYPIQSALFTPVFIDCDFLKRKTIIFNALKSAAPDTVCAQDNNGETVAHSMAMNGYEELMSDVIQENPSILLMHNHFMKYPIHMAILNRQLGILQLLLPIDSAIHLADADGCVALHYAARHSDTTMLEACIPYYPHVDVRDVLQRTPLLCAAEAGQLSPLMILVDNGADIHAVDYQGFSVLHYAVNSGNTHLVTWILGHLSVDIDAHDSAGRVARYYAEKKGFDTIAHLLANTLSP